MTIKNDELDNAVAEAQRAVAAAQEDLKNAQATLAAAQAAPTLDADGATTPTDATANASAVSSAQRNLRLGPGNPGPGKRQGDRTHRKGPQLG